MPKSSSHRRRFCKTLALLLLLKLAIPTNSVFAQAFEQVFDDAPGSWLEWESSENNEAEKDEPLETDRDSFTFATTTVGRGQTIVEVSSSQIDNRRTPDTNSYPEMITRYGLTERLELRLGWNFEAGGGGDVSIGDAGGESEELGVRQESRISYGFKYALTKQKAWRPASACIIQASTPTSGSETASRFIVGYVLGWTFFDNWKLDSSIRYGADSEAVDHFNDWAPSVVLKVPVHEKWTVHGEYFGIFTDGKASNSNPQYFSPGINYLISPDVELGIRTGWGLNQDAANFFSNIGLGVRF